MQVSKQFFFGMVLYCIAISERGCSADRYWSKKHIAHLADRIDLMVEMAQSIADSSITPKDDVLVQKILADRSFQGINRAFTAKWKRSEFALVVQTDLSPYRTINLLMLDYTKQMQALVRSLHVLNWFQFTRKRKIIDLFNAIHNLPLVYAEHDEQDIFTIHPASRSIEDLLKQTDYYRKMES